MCSLALCLGITPDVFWESYQLPGIKHMQGKHLSPMQLPWPPVLNSIYSCNLLILKINLKLLYTMLVDIAPQWSFGYGFLGKTSYILLC